MNKLDGYLVISVILVAALMVISAGLVGEGRVLEGMYIVLAGIFLMVTKMYIDFMRFVKSLEYGGG